MHSWCLLLDQAETEAKECNGAVAHSMKHNLLMQIGGFVILICLWEGVTTFFQVPEYIFPRFSALIIEFCKFPMFFLDGFLKTYLNPVRDYC